MAQEGRRLVRLTTSSSFLPWFSAGRRSSFCTGMAFTVSAARRVARRHAPVRRSTRPRSGRPPRPASDPPRAGRARDSTLLLGAADRFERALHSSIRTIDYASRTSFLSRRRLLCPRLSFRSLKATTPIRRHGGSLDLPRIPDTWVEKVVRFRGRIRHDGRTGNNDEGEKWRAPLPSRLRIRTPRGRDKGRDNGRP